ncbi:MAG TPA: DUF5602 domain-containing protein [Casimicrobiaceae bacterium]
MDRTPTSTLQRLAATAAAIVLTVAAGSAAAESGTATFEGAAVRIGKGSAHTAVRTDAAGKVISIGVVFTAGMLDGLPRAAEGADPDFPYQLGMPEKGPKTVVDHVVVNWESAGHPPPGVYDVPHFDFHFYLVSSAERLKVRFKSENESGDPSQQPPAELLPAGYMVPPGTAVSAMGVHAINPASPEFHAHPFTTTFIYGYYNKRLTFIEPMVSLAYLQSKLAFSAPIARPAVFEKRGAYPSSYRVDYDDARKSYEVSLADLQ